MKRKKDVTFFIKENINREITASLAAASAGSLKTQTNRKQLKMAKMAGNKFSCFVACLKIDATEGLLLNF